MYIYKTTNLLNGKFYIGKRVYRKRDENWYLGSGIYLNRAIKKYGKENFKKEIIEWCNNKSHLSEREIYWISYFNATNLKIGYNLSLGGDGGNVGAEAYIKIGNKLRGKKRPKEFGEKVSKALKGKPKSKEHIEKVRQALTGVPRPKEVVDKMAKSIKNKYDNGWKSPVEIEVHQYNKLTGDYIQSYKSATEAGRILNIDRKAITNNCVGKSKSSAGFIWSKLKKQNIYE
jgi:group I intron endonuclease